LAKKKKNMEAFFASLGSRTLTIFAEQEITPENLADVTDELLEKLGVPFGARDKIQKWQQEQLELQATASQGSRSMHPRPVIGDQPRRISSSSPSSTPSVPTLCNKSRQSFKLRSHRSALTTRCRPKRRRWWL